MLCELQWTRFHESMTIYKYQKDNTLNPGRNGRHFAGDIFERINMYENCRI